MSKVIQREEAISIKISPEMVEKVSVPLYVKIEEKITNISDYQNRYYPKNLYINRSDYEKFIQEIDRIGSNDVETKILGYMSCFKYQLLKFLKNPNDKESFRETVSLVSKNISIISTHKTSLDLYMKELSEQKDLLTLILFRTMVVVLMAKKMNWKSKVSIASLIQASFLCDANLLEINPAAHTDCFEDEKCPHVKDHVQNLKETIKKFEIEDKNTIMIINHHHENGDGTGPLKIKGHEIYPLAKVLRVADFFSRCLLNKNEKYTISQALQKASLNKRILDSQFVKILIECFPFQ